MQYKSISNNIMKIKTFNIHMKSILNSTTDKYSKLLYK